MVDDEAAVRATVARVLHGGGYGSVFTASSVDEAKDLLRDHEIDVVITDMQMPGGSGLDLLAFVRRSAPLTASVMVTVIDDPGLAERALALGAYGYLVKPFRHSELLTNVSNALRRRALELENKEHRVRLEGLVRDRTAELRQASVIVEQRELALRESREDTIQRLSRAAEFRDSETGAHVKRMSRYCGLLSSWVGFDQRRSEMLRTATIMHDIGKIGIPDTILLKQGPLSTDEFALMQKHAEFGHQILSGAESDLLALAATIALTHHEKWDGSGYPRGLKGAKIPLEGRIAAIAGVFDALVSNRIYRRAFDLHEAVDIMKEGRGSHFEAELLDIFIEHLDAVMKVNDAENADLSWRYLVAS